MLNPMLPNYGNQNGCMVMSLDAANAYKDANPNIGACIVLGPYPSFSMTTPNDYQTAPVIGGCGSTGEQPVRRYIGA